MQYHLEVIQIINQKTTCFCRIYAIYDNKIRQFINCPVKHFLTGKNIVFDSEDLGATIKLNDNVITISGIALDDFKLELIGCRSGKYENGKHNTSCIINAKLPELLQNIINIDNLRLKDRIN